MVNTNVKIIEVLNSFLKIVIENPEVRALYTTLLRTLPGSENCL